MIANYEQKKRILQISEVKGIQEVIGFEDLLQRVIQSDLMKDAGFGHSSENRCPDSKLCTWKEMKMFHVRKPSSSQNFGPYPRI